MVARLISRRKRPVANFSEADLYGNPYPVYRQLRAEKPVAYAPDLRHMASRPDAYWLVTRWGDVEAVLKDDETYGSPLAPADLPPTLAGSLLYANNREHAEIRSAMQPVCQPRRAGAFAEEVVLPLVDTLLDELEPLGEVDLIDSFFEPLAATTVAAYLGLEDVPTAELREWFDHLGLYFTGQPVPRLAAPVNKAIDAALLAALRRADGHAIAPLLSAMGGAGLNETQLLANAKMFAAAGMHELSDLLAHALIGLVSRPDQLAELRDDRSLAKPALEEAARWGSPVGMVPRLTASATELAGVRIPAGAYVAAVIASANRDERRWTDASTFDLHRDEGMHLAFASGVHFCLGAWIVRAAGAVTLGRLVERLPKLRLQPGDPLIVTGWRFRDVRRLAAVWS